MAKKELEGGLQTLIGRTEPTTTGQDLPIPSKVDLLKETLSDEELKELINDEERLRQAMRSKRFAGGRPKKGDTKHRESQGYGRTCIVANIDKMNKIREIAFRETLTIKQLFEGMMDNLIKTYEAKHGEVVPADHSGDVSHLFD